MQVIITIQPVNVSKTLFFVAFTVQGTGKDIKQFLQGISFLTAEGNADSLEQPEQQMAPQKPFSWCLGSLKYSKSMTSRKQQKEKKSLSHRRGTKDSGAEGFLGLSLHEHYGRRAYAGRF